MKKSYVIISLIIGISVIVVILWQLGMFSSRTTCECGLDFSVIKPLDYNLTVDGNFSGTFLPMSYPKMKIVNVGVYNVDPRGNNLYDDGCCGGIINTKKCIVLTKLPITVKGFRRNVESDRFQVIAKDCTIGGQNVGDEYNLFIDFDIEVTLGNTTIKRKDGGGPIRGRYK